VHDSFLFSFFGVWSCIWIQFLSEANPQWFSLELICTMSSWFLYSVVLMDLNAVSIVCMCAYVSWLLANSMIECFHWFQKCNRNWGYRCFYKDFTMYLSTPIHGQELM
jgi:hypothetical protein